MQDLITIHIKGREFGLTLQELVTLRNYLTQKINEVQTPVTDWLKGNGENPFNS